MYLETQTCLMVKNAQVKAANKSGYRNLILATKDTSLTMVANAKTDALPKGDLHLAWKKPEKRWDRKSREDKINSLTKFPYVPSSLGVSFRCFPS